MNLNIVTSIENTQKKYKYLWAISSKKTKLAIVTLILGGLVFFSYGLVDSSATFGGFNIFISIGLAFIIAAFMTIYSFISGRKSYFRKVDKLIGDHRDFNYKYEVTDSGFSYSSSEIKMELKWGRFSGYYHSDKYFCLLIDDELSGPLMISQSELSENDYATLLKIIKGKLPSSVLGNKVW